MYDVLGKVLLEKSMVSGETKAILSRNAQPKGIYILEIVSGKETRNTVKIRL
jgi:hypothetical protein